MDTCHASVCRFCCPALALSLSLFFRARGVCVVRFGGWLVVEHPSTQRTAMMAGQHERRCISSVDALADSD